MKVQWEEDKIHNGVPTYAATIKGAKYVVFNSVLRGGDWAVEKQLSDGSWILLGVQGAADDAKVMAENYAHDIVDKFIGGEK